MIIVGKWGSLLFGAMPTFTENLAKTLWDSVTVHDVEVGNPCCN